MWRYSELRRPKVSRWRTSFNNSSSMMPMVSSGSREGVPKIAVNSPRTPLHLGLDTCMIHVSGTEAELDGLYPGAWRSVGQRAPRRFPPQGGRERPSRHDVEAQSHDLRRQAGYLAPGLRPHDRLLHTPGHRPALRPPLAGTAHPHPRVGLPRDRALGLVRLLRRSTRVARLAGCRRRSLRVLVLRPPRGGQPVAVLLELGDRRRSLQRRYR